MEQLTVSDRIDLLTSEIQARQKHIQELKGDVLEDSDPRDPLYSSLEDSLRGAATPAIASLLDERDRLQACVRGVKREGRIPRAIQAEIRDLNILIGILQQQTTV